MDGAQHDALRSRRVRALKILRAELESDGGVDADAEAYSYRADEILDREDERQRRHRVLAYLRDKVAVHDVVERKHHHRKHHRQRHREHERQHGPLLHESLIHLRILPFFIAGHKKTPHKRRVRLLCGEKYFHTKNPLRPRGAVLYA